MFNHDFSPEKRRHRQRMRRLDRAKGRYNKRKITFSLVVATAITVAFYGMIVWSWWQAPLCMALGAFVEWCREKGDS